MHNSQKLGTEIQWFYPHSNGYRRVKTTKNDGGLFPDSGEPDAAALGLGGRLWG